MSFRLVRRVLLHLVHSVFELVGQFADKSLQRTAPLWPDLKANHVLLEGAEKVSRFRVLALQLVDHGDQYEQAL